MRCITGVTCCREELGVTENLLEILYTELVSGEIFMHI